MKLYKVLSKIALLCFVLFFTFTSASAKDEWVKVRSKNFQLVGNAAEKDIRTVAAKLEQFRETFRQIFARVNFTSPVPTNVIVFKDEKSFSDFKLVGDDGKSTEWVAGYFLGGEDVNYIVLTAEGEKSFTYRTIFHEYIHYLVDNDLGRTNVPSWFNEGLAEYYELLEIENDQKVTLGALNKDHLLLLQQNKLIPFETFFNVDNYSLQRQGHDGAGLFYAQAWALMHYLMQGNDGSRSQQLNKFMVLVLSGKTPKEAFTEAFQTDYATLERELKKYIEQKNFRSNITTFKEKLIFDGAIQSAPINESEAKAVLGDLMYHADRFTEAAVLLEEALKLDAESGLANASLGLVKMRQNKFEEAKKYLEKAVKRDDKNYLAHYRYAYVLSREGMTEYGFVSGYEVERTRKMRESLKKAIALNPNFPESYDLYAFVNYVRNEEIDEAIEYLAKAIKLAPGNQWYLVRTAELYLRKEDFSNARKIAQKVFQTAPDDQLRVYASNTINQINSYQAQLENIKNFHPGQATSVTDKSLTEEEIARLNEQAMLEGINQNLRKPKSDEKRILGYLSKIECGAKGIEYSVKVDNQAFKLESEDFNSLFLMSYARDTQGNEFGCETVKNEMFAVIIFRPTTNTKTRMGDVISIEFVPKNFRFLK